MQTRPLTVSLNSNGKVHHYEHQRAAHAHVTHVSEGDLPQSLATISDMAAINGASRIRAPRTCDRARRGIHQRDEKDIHLACDSFTRFQPTFSV